MQGNGGRGRRTAEENRAFLISKAKLQWVKTAKREVPSEGFLIRNNYYFVTDKVRIRGKLGQNFNEFRTKAPHFLQVSFLKN